MKIIGLTGNIGSGKSTVSRLLQDMGAVVIDADKVGHEVLKHDNELRRQIAAAFGSEVLAPSGDIDRRKLAEKAFRSARTTELLNQLTHPRIEEYIKNSLEEYRRQRVGVVVLEATLLIETEGLKDLVDEIWVTVSSRAITLQRLRERGLSEAEALARMERQMPAEEKIKHADVVIENDGDLNHLKSRVQALWRGLRAGESRKTG